MLHGEEIVYLNQRERLGNVFTLAIWDSSNF